MKQPIPGSLSLQCLKVRAQSQQLLCWYQNCYSYNQTKITGGNHQLETSVAAALEALLAITILKPGSRRGGGSGLAAEALPELAELVLVHLALPLLLDAVRPHLRLIRLPSVLARVKVAPCSRDVDEGRVYVHGGMEGEQEVPELRVRGRGARERRRRGLWLRVEMRRQVGEERDGDGERRRVAEGEAQAQEEPAGRGGGGHGWMGDPRGGGGGLDARVWDGRSVWAGAGAAKPSFPPPHWDRTRAQSFGVTGPKPN